MNCVLHTSPTVRPTNLKLVSVAQFLGWYIVVIRVGVTEGWFPKLASRSWPGISCVYNIECFCSLMLQKLEAFAYPLPGKSRLNFLEEPFSISNSTVPGALFRWIIHTLNVRVGNRSYSHMYCLRPRANGKNIVYTTLKDRHLLH